MGACGRTVVGLVMRTLLVNSVDRKEDQVIADMVSKGETGTKVFTVCIRKHRVLCSCNDYRK